MKLAIIAVLSILGLSGCTMMSHRTMDREPTTTYSGFPPTYSGGKSEYRPSPTEDFSRDSGDTKKLGKLYYPVRAIPPAVKNALVNELEDLNQKELAFIAVIDVHGNVRLLRKNNEKHMNSRRLTTKPILIKSIVPFTILTYKGSPDCVNILHNVTIAGEFYSEYCDD